MKDNKLFRINFIILLLAGMILCYSCRNDISIEKDMNTNTRGFGSGVNIGFDGAYGATFSEMELITQTSFKIDGSLIDIDPSSISYIELEIDTDESFLNNWVLRGTDGYGGDVVINRVDGTFSGEFGVFKGGEYVIRALVHMNNGTTYNSNVIYLNTNYPSIETIQEQFFSYMEDTWNNLSNTTSNAYNRKEYGYYIYIKGGMIKPFENSDLCIGEANPCGGTQSVQIVGSESQSGPCEPDMEYIIAQFHTHPPLSECPGNEFRVGGPSEEIDLIAHATQEHPCFVYDYIGTVHGGHLLSKSAKIYRYGIPKRID